MKEDEDFGFSFMDSEDVNLKTEDYNKAVKIKNMIMPLLKNLLKNPEKDTIVWPNRKERIEAFILEMDDIISS